MQLNEMQHTNPSTNLICGNAFGKWTNEREAKIRLKTFNSPDIEIRLVERENGRKQRRKWDKLM